MIHEQAAGLRLAVAYLPASMRPACFLATCLLGACLLAGCVPDAADIALPTPTPLPAAVVPEEPTCPVQWGRFVDSLVFAGTVSPVRRER